MDRMGRDQRGLTLIEVLIAIVVVSVLMTSASIGVITLMRTSSNTNFQARTDALLTGYGEVLKQLEYRPCATASEYEAAVDDYEDSLPAAERLEQGGASQASASIESVDAGSRCGDNVDAGTQVINISATLRGRQRTAQVVKRNPDAAPSGTAAR